MAEVSNSAARTAKKQEDSSSKKPQSSYKLGIRTTSLPTDSPYEANADIDIEKQDDGDNLPKDANLERIDKYMDKLNKNKSQLLLESSMKEMSRVDQSLLNMLRRIDNEKFGGPQGPLFIEQEDIDPNYPPTAAARGIIDDPRVKAVIIEREHEIEMLKTKLGLREEQLKQIVEVSKGGGKLSNQDLELAITEDKRISQDVKEVRKMRMEIEQMKRLSQRLTFENKEKENEIAKLKQEATNAERKHDRLSLELETTKKKVIGNVEESEMYKGSIEKLKEEAKKIIADKERLVQELDTLKRAKTSKETDMKKDLSKTIEDYEEKLSALEKSQTNLAKTKQAELEALVEENGKIKKEILRINNEASVSEQTSKKMVTKLEADIITLRQELLAAKVVEGAFELAKKKEAESIHELKRLRYELESQPKQLMQPYQIEKMQKDNEEMKTQLSEQATTIAKLKHEVNSLNELAAAAKRSHEKSMQSLAEANSSEVIKLKNTITDLKNTVTKQKEEIEQLGKLSTATSDAAVSRIEKLEETKKGLSREVDGLKAELESKVSKISELEEKLRVEKRRASAAARGLDDEVKRRDIGEGGVTAAQLQEEVKRLKEQIADEEKKKQNTIVKMNEKMVSKDKEIEGLRKELEEAKKNADRKQVVEVMPTPTAANSSEEVQELKKQLAAEEKKKQAIIDRFNNRLAEKDRELEAAVKAGGNMQTTAGSDANEWAKQKRALENKIFELQSELENREDAKAGGGGDANSESQIASYKELIQKQKQALAQSKAEVASLKKELEQASKGGNNAALQDELNQMTEKLHQQLQMVVTLSDKVDRYEMLLRKNKIAYK